MDFEVKKLETCFADAENYEYRVAADAGRLWRLLVEEQGAELRVNERLRRPVFIATLANGTRVKGELGATGAAEAEAGEPGADAARAQATLIRVGYLSEAASEQKAAFENWLSAPR
jgi:hypothetical protein